MQGWICQGYKAIKAIGGLHGARTLKATRLKAIKATGGVCRDEFLKATRLSRIREGYVVMSFSKLRGH